MTTGLLCYRFRLYFLLNSLDGEPAWNFSRASPWFQKEYLSACKQGLTSPIKEKEPYACMIALSLIRDVSEEARRMAGDHLPHSDRETNRAGYQALTGRDKVSQHMPEDIALDYYDILLLGVKDKDDTVRMYCLFALIFVYKKDVSSLKKNLGHLLNDADTSIRRLALVVLPAFTGREPWKQELKVMLESEKIRLNELKKNPKSNARDIEVSEDIINLIKNKTEHDKRIEGFRRLKRIKREENKSVSL